MNSSFTLKEAEQLYTVIPFAQIPVFVSGFSQKGEKVAAPCESQYLCCTELL